MEASIILVIYNGMQYLPGCLGSLEPELNANRELILVDNASTDGSAEYIQNHHPQVSLVQNDKNIGFAAACNQGAELAQGEFLIFLNQDTRVSPGWLENLLAPFTSDSSIGLVTSKLLLMSSPDKINMCGQDIHFSGLTFARGLLHPKTEYERGGQISAVSGASFAIPRYLWRRLGGFDEQLFMYYEETDLCWRARLAGFTSFFAPASVAYHDYQLKSSPGALYYSARNRRILLLEYWRIPTLILLAPGLILADLVELGLMALYRRPGLSAKLHADFWLVTHLPVIFRGRLKTQALRQRPDISLLQNCTFSLNPQLVTGGAISRIAIWICNGLFFINYWVARTLVRWLGL